jgi:hypothetical protein
MTSQHIPSSSDFISTPTFGGDLVVPALYRGPSPPHPFKVDHLANHPAYQGDLKQSMHPD